jgi:putative ABC transport system permease protein
MSVYFMCAMRSLGRKKLRTFLTASGIAIGVASVIVIGAIGESGKASVFSELDSLGINGLSITEKTTASKSVQVPIDADDLSACLKVKGIRSAMPVIMQYGTVAIHNDESSALFWGVGDNAKELISIGVKYGSMFSRSDISCAAPTCLVDEAFANKYYRRPNVTGERIHVYFGKNYTTLTVKGVVTSGSGLLSAIGGAYVPYFIYLPYTTAENLRGTSGYDEIAVKTLSENNIDSIGGEIVSVLSHRHVLSSYAANNMFRQRQRLNNLTGIVTLIISSVGAISLIVAGLGIMTVMTVTVSERTREIGIKKALGAKNSVILREFLAEALVICCFGCIIGISAGLLTAFAVTTALKFSFALSPQTIIMSCAFALASGLSFGIYPAVKASRLKPIDALRYE